MPLREIVPNPPTTPLFKAEDRDNRLAWDGMNWNRLWEWRDADKVYYPILERLYPNRGIAPLWGTDRELIPQYGESRTEVIRRNLYRDAWNLRNWRRTDRGRLYLDQALQVVSTILSVDYTDRPIIAVRLGITTITADTANLTTAERLNYRDYIKRVYEWMFGIRAEVTVVFTFAHNYNVRYASQTRSILRIE